MRVYVGLTLSRLREVRDRGVIGPAPLPAFAVTPRLRESYAEGDSEELEYAALSAAARHSLTLLDADPSATRRRVVVVVEAADAHVSWRPDAGPAAVVVDGELPLAHVASLHVDDPAAADTIAAAADAVAAAELGDEDAAFAVDEADGWELMWFATQELDDLLADGLR